MGRPQLDMQLIPPEGPVVAMVSGGSDSTALLLLLVEALGPSRVRVLHVNHLLRGAESDADERFVAELAARLGVPCEVQRIDVAALAEAERANLEALARRERYAAARELAAAAGAACIATAHTRDDRVETFLMRASVGTGPGGLGSIRPRAADVIHPLLSCSRGELRAWLASCGQEWREDATNLTSDRDRTFMRNEVLPLLRAHNPAFDANLARTMGLVAAEDDFLAAQAADLLECACKAVEPARVERICGTLGLGPSALLLDAPTIASAPRVLARRAIRQAFAQAGGSDCRPDARHIEWAVDGAAREGFATDVDKTLSVRNICQTLVFAASDDPVPCDALDSALADAVLPLPGVLSWGGRRVAAEVVANVDAADLRAIDPAHEAFVDVGEASELWVGRIRVGERMVPLGLAQGSKKLADVLADAKVPRALRQQLPVVRIAGEGGDVVWLAGVCVDERHRVSASTVRAVHLTFE